MDLYDTQRRRLYLTAEERRDFLAAATDAPRAVRTFCLVLHDTGSRIGEALALTPRSVDLSDKAMVPGNLSRSLCEIFILPIDRGSGRRLSALSSQVLQELNDLLG